MNTSYRALLTTILFVYSNSTQAGGPLILEGPAGNTPVSYQNPAITVNVEGGDLGVLSNAAADTLVQQAFDLWNNVGSSTINLIIDQTQITTDINSTNFKDYLPAFNGDTSNSDDGLNPVVYDSDGAIIDLFFGNNASDNTIGFAASVFNVGSSFYSEGYAVINGKDLSPPLTATEKKLLIAHEIGHFFGLDHSQTNINNKETNLGTPFFCTTSISDDYPVMYPFVCRNDESLHADDISAVSALYPDTSLNSSHGILQGRFVDDTGAAILGANIYAENTTTGEAISGVSDYLRQNNGFYKLYLPAGNYTLHANSINSLFNGGSSIGPYSFFTTSASFLDPHPITDVTYQGNTPGSSEVLTITAGQTVSVVFSISGGDIVVASSTDNSDDGFANLFGASSTLTILLLPGILVSMRYAGRYRPA